MSLDLAAESEQRLSRAAAPEPGLPRAGPDDDESVPNDSLIESETLQVTRLTKPAKTTDRKHHQLTRSPRHKCK